LDLLSFVEKKGLGGKKRKNYNSQTQMNCDCEYISRKP